MTFYINILIYADLAFLIGIICIAAANIRYYDKRISNWIAIVD